MCASIVPPMPAARSLRLSSSRPPDRRPPAQGETTKVPPPLPAADRLRWNPCATRVIADDPDNDEPAQASSHEHAIGGSPWAPAAEESLQRGAVAPDQRFRAGRSPPRSRHPGAVAPAPALHLDRVRRRPRGPRSPPRLPRSASRGPRRGGRRRRGDGRRRPSRPGAPSARCRRGLGEGAPRRRGHEPGVERDQLGVERRRRPCPPRTSRARSRARPRPAGPGSGPGSWCCPRPGAGRSASVRDDLGRVVADEAEQAAQQSRLVDPGQQQRPARSSSPRSRRHVGEPSARSSPIQVRRARVAAEVHELVEAEAEASRISPKDQCAARTARSARSGSRSGRAARAARPTP